jgi:hypothetical protein
VDESTKDSALGFISITLYLKALLGSQNKLTNSKK